MELGSGMEGVEEDSVNLQGVTRTVTIFIYLLAVFAAQLHNLWLSKTHAFQVSQSDVVYKLMHPEIV